MEILKVISSLGIFSIVSILVYILYYVGRMSQIRSSKFLEQFDNKNTLLENAMNVMFKYDRTLIEPYIIMIPFALYALVLYVVSPSIVSVLQSYDVIPSDPTITYLLFMLCHMFFLFGELLFCYSENNMVRKSVRIYYNRPIYLIIIIIIILVACNFIDSIVATETKKKAFEILGIITKRDVQIFHTFLGLGYIMTIFPLKWVTRWIVLIDFDIYINNLKEPNNKYLSFAGIASTILSILMVLVITFFALNNKISFISYGDIAVFIIIILLTSILAGQRVEFVKITRRFEVFRKKIYYLQASGKHKLWEK